LTITLQQNQNFLNPRQHLFLKQIGHRLTGKPTKNVKKLIIFLLGLPALA
jgi:hypothetical protein